MVSNESRPQGTSISEQYGRPVTLEDIEGLMDKEGVRRGTAVKVLNAIRAWSAWNQAKAARPWDFTQGGLSQVDNERTRERRARIAERLNEEAQARKAARNGEANADAEIIELPVIPGQTIAEAVAEFTREEPEPEPEPIPEPEEVPVLPEPELIPEPPAAVPEEVAAVLEEVLAPVTPEPEPEAAAALPELPELTPAPEPEENLLPCGACGMDLPVDRFAKDASRSTGRDSRCRACRSAQRAAARLKNSRERERLREIAARDAQERLREMAERQHQADARLREGLRLQEAAREARRAARAVAAAVAQQAAAAVPATPQQAAASAAGTSQCRTCGQVLPVAEFRKDASTKAGIRHQCRQCERDYDKNRRRNRVQEQYALPFPEMRTCRKCGQERRTDTEFYHRTGRDISRTCRYCEQEAARNRRKA